TASFVNSTIASNTANGAATDEGGGIRNTSGSSCSLINTIVVANVDSQGGSTADVGGAFTSGGSNIIGRTDGSTGWITDPGQPDHDFTGTDAQPLNSGLADFGNHGGPTDTTGIGAMSPAVNTARSSSAPSTDQ